MTFVFVSYSRKDTEFVLKLTTDLKVRGVNIWLDQLNIPTGQRWDRAIEEALRATSHLLVVLSKTSVVSENVLDEIDFALSQGKIILPILVDAVEPPLRIRRMQYTDFRGDYSEAIARVLPSLPIAPAAIPTSDVQTSMGLPMIQDAELTEDTVEGIIPVLASVQAPQVTDLKLLRQIANTGLSTIYLVEDAQAQQFLLKKRPKTTKTYIDFSKIALPAEKFALPTKVWEDESAIYELMPFYEGWGLDEVLKLNQAGVRGTLLEIWAIELLELLSYLHRHDPPIIHRDLKPENILVTPMPHHLILLDLSSAVFYDPSTTYGSLGTMGYVPPEQIDGNPTPASDLYALAATLYRLNRGIQPPTFYERQLQRGDFKLVETMTDMHDLFALLSRLDVAWRPMNAQSALSSLWAMKDERRRTETNFMRVKEPLMLPDGSTINQGVWQTE